MKAGERTIASFKPDELDLIVDHYFARTIDLMHEGYHDKIREAVHGIFQDIRVGRYKPQLHAEGKDKS